jgi:ribonuclease J
MTIGKRIPGGYVFVDGAQVGEIGKDVLAQREALGRSGFVTAVVRYSRKKGEPVEEPQIVTRGFMADSIQSELIERAADVVRSAAWVKAGVSAEDVRQAVEKALSRFFYKETRSRPVVTAVVVED